MVINIVPESMIGQTEVELYTTECYDTVGRVNVGVLYTLVKCRDTANGGDIPSNMAR